MQRMILIGTDTAVEERKESEGRENGNEPTEELS
jgi:hypothetical protein